MNKDDREYVAELVEKLDSIIELIKDNAYRDDIEKQRELRENNRKYLKGRFVKRSFLKLAEEVEKERDELKKMVEDSFDAKEILKNVEDEETLDEVKVEEEE